MYSPSIHIAPEAVKSDVLTTVMVVTTASIAPFNVDADTADMNPPHGDTPHPVPAVLTDAPVPI
jgi:predicted RNA methylase